MNKIIKTMDEMSDKIIADFANTPLSTAEQLVVLESVIFAIRLVDYEKINKR